MENHSFFDRCYKLWVLMAQTRDAIWKARHRELLKYQLSAPAIAVLIAVETIGDKATPANISRYIFREVHSVSELLNRMEKKGLIRRTKGMNGKNRVGVSLTEKGREIYQSQLEDAKSICNIMSVLSEEEIQQMRSFLEKLQVKALEEIVSQYKIPVPAFSNDW